eukprot:11001576-Alexandrium_andersonii.AAC.1
MAALCWTCQQCGAQNWNSRDKCRKCKQGDKPSWPKNNGRQPSKHGAPSSRQATLWEGWIASAGLPSPGHRAGGAAVLPARLG